MKKVIVLAALAAAGLGASLTDIHKSPPVTARLQAETLPEPTLEALRAELFMPHYARIKGMFDTLPEGFAASLDLVQDMGRMHLRFMDMEADVDPILQESYRLEGIAITKAGELTPDGLNGYIISVLDADDLIFKRWCTSTIRMEGIGIEHEDANYLTLMSLSIDGMGFMERHPPSKPDAFIEMIRYASFEMREILEDSALIAKAGFELLDRAYLEIAPKSAPTEPLMLAEF